MLRSVQFLLTINKTKPSMLARLDTSSSCTDNSHYTNKPHL